MKSFFYEFNRAAKQGPRMYFAPLVGAFKAIKAELRKGQAPDPRQSAPRNGHHADSRV